MTRIFLRAALVTTLALVTAPPAFASNLDLDARGSGHKITASAFGNAQAGLVVQGDGDQVDFFAGPCSHRMRSTTVLRGWGERRVVVAHCF